MPKQGTKRTKSVNQKNLDIYGHKAIPWSRADKLLRAGPEGGTFWLATTRPGGRPHVAGVGALWVDGRVYFVTGARTRKGRNLAENASCVFSVTLKGMDVVMEGSARRVTDEPTLRRLAKKYADGGWPAKVSGEAFTAFGVASAEPHGATRWRFS